MTTEALTSLWKYSQIIFAGLLPHATTAQGKKQTLNKMLAVLKRWPRNNERL